MATDMFRSYDAAAKNPSIQKDYTACLSRRPTLAQGTVARRMGLDGNWNSLVHSRHSPTWGRLSVRLLNSLTRELVCNGIVLAVDMPNCPGTTSKSKGFPQIVAFLKEDTEVVAVATPIAPVSYTHLTLPTILLV